MPLFPKSFSSGPYSLVYLEMVLVGRNAMRSCVFLKMLVIFMTAGLKNMEVVHFLCSVSCVVFFCLCLRIWLFKWFIIPCVYPLSRAMCITMSSSLFLLSSDKGSLFNHCV
jgi:hypothetical protein